MKRNTLMAMLVVGTVVAMPAMAGYRYTMPVVVDAVNRNARGTMGDARASADNTQYIGCSTRAYPTYVQVVCYAVNATGVQGQCSTTASTFLQAVQTMTANSTIYFSWDASGACTNVSIDNFSSTTPVTP